MSLLAEIGSKGGVSWRGLPLTSMDEWTVYSEVPKLVVWDGLQWARRAGAVAVVHVAAAAAASTWRYLV